MLDMKSGSLTNMDLHFLCLTPGTSEITIGSALQTTLGVGVRLCTVERTFNLPLNGPFNG